MNGEIICSGTELLLGDVLNTHSAFISKNIAPLGINIYYHTVVGDNEARLRATVKTALGRSDLLIITGGLGPTYDDITKRVVYGELGLIPFLDPDAEKKLRAYFDKLGRPMTDNNLTQVMRPENAFFFDNDFGTAPGVCLRHLGKTIIMLPGPPRELVPMFNNYVLPFLMEMRDKVLFSRTIRCFGIGEAALEDLLSDIMRNSSNPTLAPYVENFEVKLRVTASATMQENAKTAVDAMVESVRAIVGDYCYGVDISGLEEALVRLCVAKRVKVTTAESCTGGLVSARITSVAGASAVFDMGFCTYADDAKTKLLGVPPEVLESNGAVSAKTARAMAEGALFHAHADYAVAVTGIAGPGGGSAEKPVGTVFIAAASKDGRREIQKLALGTNARSRDDIRLISSSHALKALIDLINS